MIKLNEKSIIKAMKKKLFTAALIFFIAAMAAVVENNKIAYAAPANGCVFDSIGCGGATPWCLPESGQSNCYNPCAGFGCFTTQTECEY